MSADDAPYFISIDDPAIGLEAGEPNSDGISRYNAAFRQLPRHKLHLQYNLDEFETWFRWTRGGRDTTANYNSGIRDGFSDDNIWSGGQQQITWHANYRRELSETLDLELKGGYDSLEMYVRQPNSSPFTNPDRKLRTNHREEDWQFAGFLRWTPDEQQAFAFGYELGYETFGNKTFRFPDEPAFGQFRPVGADKWSVTHHALVSEYQRNFEEDWTLFVGGRFDKHRYTDTLFSPRAALIYTPDNANTLKTMLSRSVRRDRDPQLREAYVNDGEINDEKIDILEVSYQHLLDSSTSLRLSVFYGLQEVLSFVPNAPTGGSGELLLVGEREFYGLEFEYSHQSGPWQILFSHSYTQLIELDLEDPDETQRLSAEPYGFGSDDVGVANHTTKLYTRYDIDNYWSAYASLNIEWGFPGSKDFAEYNNQQPTADLGSPLTEPGENDAFDGNYYFNLGTRYKFSDNLTASFDGYNLLGLIDEDLNKVNMVFPFSEYRELSPSFAVGVNYKF